MVPLKARLKNLGHQWGSVADFEAPLKGCLWIRLLTGMLLSVSVSNHLYAWEGLGRGMGVDYVADCLKQYKQ